MRSPPSHRGMSASASGLLTNFEALCERAAMTLVLEGASAGAGSGADPRAGGYADAEESNARFYNHPHPASTRGPAFEEASELETAWMDPRAAPFRLGVAQPAGSAPGQARHTMQMVWPSDLMLL